MTDERREILSRVAAGELSPEEAAWQLDELGSPPPPPPPPAGAVAKVRVIGDFRTAKIVGDPEVIEAIAEGPHTVTRDGDTLVINAGDGEPESGEWTFPGGGRGRSRAIVIGIGSKPKPVSIRMNPRLALEVRIDAGSATIEGVHGPISGDIDAGAFRVKDFTSPFDLQVDAGSITAEGVLDRGDSRIKCDAGNVRVVLKKGSSVKVRARADVGHVSVGSETTKGIHIGSAEREFVFGDGAGTLSIEGGIGKIKVEAE
ncbi:MAG: hypothetical protein ABR552_05960 [Actinomycetota bacterium]